MLSWSDGLPDVVAQQVLRHVVGVANSLASFRATCKTWKRQMPAHVDQLDITPLPQEELQVLSTAFPNVTRLSITRGRAEIRGLWIQTEHIAALIKFSVLESLVLDSMTVLRREELQLLLHQLASLRSLSLPNVQSFPKDCASLITSPKLTSLKMDQACFQYSCWTLKSPTSVLQSLHCQLHLSFAGQEEALEEEALQKFAEILASLSAIDLYLTCRSFTFLENFQTEQFEVARLLHAQLRLKQLTLVCNYDQNTAFLMSMLSSLSSFVSLNLWRLYKQDLVEYDDELWMSTLTSVTCLKTYSLGSQFTAALTCMTWLSSLHLQRVESRDSEIFSELSVLTRLTSLQIYSQHLDTPRCTFLMAIQQLARCDLRAASEYRGTDPVKTIMSYGVDALFALSALTHLRVFTQFPTKNQTSILPTLSTRLQSLDFTGSSLVPMYFLNVVASLTTLTRLTLQAGKFCGGLSILSSLKNMKELELVSCEVSDVDLAFLCEYRYLAALKLASLALTSQAFRHADNLGNLTILEMSQCICVTDDLFANLTGLTNLRALWVRNCHAYISYRPNAVSRLLQGLRRLKHVNLS